jgi:hypothetical protein
MNYRGGGEDASRYTDTSGEENSISGKEDDIVSIHTHGMCSLPLEVVLPFPRSLPGPAYAAMLQIWSLTHLPYARDSVTTTNGRIRTGNEKAAGTSHTDADVKM